MKAREASAERLTRLARAIDDRTGGALSIVRRALASFSAARGPEAAAGMAYYAFFSLFPLLLFLVAAGSFVLQRKQVYDQVVRLVGEAIPTSQTLIEGSLQRVIASRGTVGIIGLVSLLWSAMSFFGVLADHLTRAWPSASPRSFLRQRLTALKIVGALVVLLVLSLAFNLLAGLLPRLWPALSMSASVFASPVWVIGSYLVPVAFSILMFAGLYRWVPNVKVRWPGALGSALVAALAWNVALKGFGWYLSSGLSRYEPVYGSLGAVVALLFWIYLSCLITLFGAHLAAAIDQRQPLAL